LGKDVDFTRGRVKRPLDGDFKALLLRPSAVPGEFETFFDNGVDVDAPVLAGRFVRVQQHVLDDRIRASAVMDDLFEGVTQRLGQFIKWARIIERQALQSVIQLIDELRGKRREVVDSERFFISCAMPAVS
jgi:hypothetical protein